MKGRKPYDIVISGLGVSSSIGHGRARFAEALLEGRHNFGVMQRPGRQYASAAEDSSDGPGCATSFLGAELPAITMPDSIPEGRLRTASLASRVAVATLHEAWTDAGLDEVDPERIGLIVGGSNFQQRELVRTYQAYHERLQFLRPSYGFSFMDSDLAGLCTEMFGIRAFAHTLGGASASGQLAVLEAIAAVESGRADVCIALGAMMDLSYWECQGFRSLGAMGSDRFANEPALACRPFDRDRDGFIFGEACGAIVVEKRSERRNTNGPYARVRGWATAVDGNRNPNPSVAGEVKVINRALVESGLSAGKIDYVNTHGTGSPVGDETELQALHQCGLGDAFLNATKSIVGHGLTSAGAVEIIATVLQMREGRLHPTRNLKNPIEPCCNWVTEKSIPHSIQYALKLSMGFGGVNSAICLEKY